MPAAIIASRYAPATSPRRISVPAENQGELQPTIYRFKFGEFEIANIMDSKVVRDGLHPAFGGEAEALCRANHIDPKRYGHPFIPTVVNTGKQLILFDTGNGALRREHEQLRNRAVDGHLMERLGQAGYKADEIDLVVITDGHPDHIGGLTEGGKPVMSKARYVFGAAEFDFWTRGENVREARRFNRELFMQIAVPLAGRATFSSRATRSRPASARSMRPATRRACWPITSRARASAC
jgi:hypothetical protein